MSEKQDKKKLSDFVIKRINTTMIGAIADLEKYNIDENLFNEIRDSILDRGNREKRIFLQEIEKYDVKFLLKKYNFPIQRIK